MGARPSEETPVIQEERSGPQLVMTVPTQEQTQCCHCKALQLMLTHAEYGLKLRATSYVQILERWWGVEDLYQTFTLNYC